MATVACPGCGLPRAEAEVGATPCPVCATTPKPVTGTPTPKKHAADPTAGLPADASELNAPVPRPPGGSRLLVGAVAFIFGTLCGVGGLLGFQAIDWAKFNKGEPEVAAKPEEPATTEGLRSPTAEPAIAPMPHELAAKTEPLAFGPEPDEPEPEAKQVQAPMPGHVETHDFNEPKDTRSVPVLKRGEHVVLRGRVKTLRLRGLDAGATLDASKLDAAVIIVSGKIDGRSTLKLNAPGGVVQISAKVDGRSTVEITAPGGEVKFMLATTPTREGSKIDNGSTVSVTARIVEFKGDITGIDTKVNIILSRSAVLKIASLSGKATVEYKSQAAGWSPPEVTVGFLSPTATFRKID
jgi:hypothetical protein